MLSIFNVRAQSAAPAARQGAGAPKPAAVKPQPKKPVTPGMGQDSLTLSKKPTPAKKPAHPPTKKPVTPAKPVAPAKPVTPPPPPEPPVAESVDAAIAAALKGDPVRVPMAVGPAKPLAVKALDPVDGAARYETTLGTQTVTVTIAAGQDATAAVTKMLQLFLAVRNDLRDPLTAVRINDANDATEAFSVESSNLNGHPASVAFKRTGTETEHNVYEMTDDAMTVRVLAPSGSNRGWELAQAAWLYDQMPQRLRGVLKTIEINNGANPQDAYWEQTYNMKGFVSAATGGGEVIHFWNGDRNMWDDVFHHEVGHLVGQRLSTKNTMWPDGWEEAIAADGKTVTDYSKASPAEDFAESWSTYTRLKAGKKVYSNGAMLQDVADFETKFPARAKMLAAAWEVELKAQQAAKP